VPRRPRFDLSVGLARQQAQGGELVLDVLEGGQHLLAIGCGCSVPLGVGALHAGLAPAAVEERQ
jgi:hypothetical protein